MSKDKLETYNNFLLNGSVNQLSDFTPEEIVMVYMNLVFEHNIEKLYLLTYNGGQLPTVDVFIGEYPKNFSSELEMDYLMYRYYDDISINAASNEDVTVVQLEIVFGKSRYIKTYPLKQEDGIWKVAIYQKLEA
ncbi:hypothetical protein [Psychrobacillus sp. L4]|uniref:hypothetical protein n=1 Tax=Psychrobacillus sp. L4 TaxID=3236892 RepID=UPI0036F3F7C3